MPAPVSSCHITLARTVSQPTRDWLLCARVGLFSSRYDVPRARAHARAEQIAGTCIKNKNASHNRLATSYSVRARWAYVGPFLPSRYDVPQARAEQTACRRWEASGETGFVGCRICRGCRVCVGLGWGGKYAASHHHHHPRPIFLTMKTLMEMGRPSSARVGSPSS